MEPKIGGKAFIVGPEILTYIHGWKPNNVAHSVMETQSMSNPSN